MSRPSTFRPGRSALLGATVLTLTLTACGGPKTATKTTDTSTITIGASLPLSGDLAGFGAFQKWGYDRAVKEVNDAGGISIGGKKEKVNLVLLDDKTDPNQVSSNTQTLISSNKAVGVLGSCTPSLVIPGAIVADRSKIPFVTGCAPVLTFAAAKKWTCAAVQKAKNSGADVLLVDAGTPQAISIRKQMVTAGYRPKVLVMEKGAEPVQYAKALGNLANGVIVAGYWDPSFPFPGAKALGTDYTKETGQGYSQHIADSYTAAKVLLDAIGKAGSTDAAAVNTAVGATDATYPVGKIKFAANHTATIPLAELQWQNGKTVVVWPTARKTGSLLFPVPAA